MRRPASQKRTPKRKKRKHNAVTIGHRSIPKTTISASPEFYFRAKKFKVHTICTDSQSNLVESNHPPLLILSGLHAKTPDVSSAEIRYLDPALKENNNVKEAFKTWGIRKVQEDIQLQQRHHVPLFSNTPRIWKSSVKENDHYPE